MLSANEVGGLPIPHNEMARDESSDDDSDIDLEDGQAFQDSNEPELNADGQPIPEVTWSPEEDELLRVTIETMPTKNWSLVKDALLGKTERQCKQRWNVLKRLNDNKSRVPWSKEEDDRLKELTAIHGQKAWKLISSLMAGRKSKQCRERWTNVVDPKLNYSPWSEEEEQILIIAQSELGNKWSQIEKRLPGRSANSIKNYWYSALRRGERKKAKQDRKSQQSQSHHHSSHHVSSSESLASIDYDMDSQTNLVGLLAGNGGSSGALPAPAAAAKPRRKRKQSSSTTAATPGGTGDNNGNGSSSSSNKISLSNLDGFDPSGLLGLVGDHNNNNHQNNNNGTSSDQQHVDLQQIFRGEGEEEGGGVGGGLVEIEAIALKSKGTAAATAAKRKAAKEAKAAAAAAGGVEGEEGTGTTTAKKGRGRGRKPAAAVSVDGVAEATGEGGEEGATATAEGVEGEEGGDDANVSDKPKPKKRRKLITKEE